MQPTPSSDSDVAVRNVDELEQIFHDAEKPSARHRIGAEAEKFGLEAETLAPVAYTGPRSILAIFER